MYGGTEALCSDVNMDDDALRLASQSSIAIGHGKSDHLERSALIVASSSTGAYLIRTGDDLGELALLLNLAFDNGFNDGRVVAPKVHKDVGDAILPQCLEKGEGCSIAVAASTSVTKHWSGELTP
jgi:hypothetical protein